MAHERSLKLVLCWHLHQPDYRDHVRDQFQLPWVYLHAIKDYTDMAAHVEACPGATTVFNFSPVLLEQLEDYERVLDAHLKEGRPVNDPLLAALDAPVLPADPNQRIALIRQCLRCNRKNMIEPFPPYQRLTQIAELILHDGYCAAYVSDQYLADLLTWYHLAWTGESVRRSDARVQQMIEQGSGFTLQQRRDFLRIIHDLIAQLRRRYSTLAAEGRIELSASPYAHPMIPLLIDFNAARESLPASKLPRRLAYPGGCDRADWHIRRGIEVHARYFGAAPRGCWPSEGGISAQTLDLLARSGFRWAATGGGVLRNSVRKSSPGAIPAGRLVASWRNQGADLRLFARNDELSDLIGFRYADWHSHDAVADLIHRLEGIADHHHDADDAVVSIIMDGENAWEHYPRNGWHFLSHLYERLAAHPRIRLTTFNELTSGPAQELGSVVAGSWVLGTFSTWIGDEHKNRAWDILCEAKDACDRVCSRGACDAQQQDRTDRQLGACEASDWYWWFGDLNPADTVRDFERLFRMHVANLYRMIGEEPPESLAQQLYGGSGAPARGGVMLPGAETRA